MSKKVIIYVIVFLAISVITIFLLVKKNKTPPPATVTASYGRVAVKVTAVGNIVAETTTQVKSPISGIVAEFYHDEGDWVKKNDQLLAVKPQPTPQDYANAKQKVEVDLSKEKTDLIEVNRYRYLIKQGAIAKNDQDYAKATQQYHADRLARELDQNLLALLEKGQATLQGKQINNIISSPVDGYIAERAVNLGDPVAPQTDYQVGNVLFTIIAMDTLMFRGQVNETDAAKLKVGMAAEIKMAALPELNISGKIRRLGLQSVQLNTPSSPAGNNNKQPDTALFNVGYKIEINYLTIPAKTLVRAGYSATADIIVAEKNQVLILPERAIQFENGQAYAWPVSKNGQPRRQLVEIGLSDGIHVEILNGLSAGEKVLEQPPEAV